MDYFDVSMGWVLLLSSTDDGGVMAAAEDLARSIGRLRQIAGLSPEPAALVSAAGPAPGEPTPIIILACPVPEAEADRGGYSWRIGHGRIEVYGDSPRGLRKGIYDFLGTLGVRYPRPGIEAFPDAPDHGPRYPISRHRVHVPSAGGPASRKRLLPEAPYPDAAGLAWAARSGYDAVVLPPRKSSAGRYRKTAALCARYGLIIETGCSLEAWSPGRLSLIGDREVFRMESGRRSPAGGVCPTNPRSPAIWQKRLRRLFKDDAEAGVPGRALYHLWISPKPPRPGNPLRRYCSCPSCRAFSPEEQVLMALNTAADALAAIVPGSLVSYPAECGGLGTVTPRSNMVAIGAEADRP